MDTPSEARAGVRGCLTLALMTFVLAVAVHASSAGAGTGLVTGAVKDASARPLAGVAVRLESSNAQVVARTSTDEDRRFVFTDIPAGAYVIVAEREGYDTGTTTGVVSDEERWSVALALTPRPVLESVIVIAPREDPRVMSTPPAIGGPVSSMQQAVRRSPLRRVVSGWSASPAGTGGTEAERPAYSFSFMSSKDG